MQTNESFDVSILLRALKSHHFEHIQIIEAIAVHASLESFLEFFETLRRAISKNFYKKEDISVQTDTEANL